MTQNEAFDQCMVVWDIKEVLQYERQKFIDCVQASPLSSAEENDLIALFDSHASGVTDCLKTIKSVYIDLINTLN